MLLDIVRDVGDDVDEDIWEEPPPIAISPSAWNLDVAVPYVADIERAARRKLTPALWKVLGYVPIESLEDVYARHMADGVPDAFAAMAALSTPTVMRHCKEFYAILRDPQHVGSELYYAAYLIVNHIDDDPKRPLRELEPAHWDISPQDLTSLGPYLLRLHPDELDRLTSSLGDVLDVADENARAYIQNLRTEHIINVVHEYMEFRSFCEDQGGLQHPVALNMPVLVGPYSDLERTVILEIAKDPEYACMIDELLSGVGSGAQATERQALMYCTVLLQVHRIPALAGQRVDLYMREQISGIKSVAATLKCTRVDEAVSTLDRIWSVGS